MSAFHIQYHSHFLFALAQAIAADAQLQALTGNAMEQAAALALAPEGPPDLAPSVVAAACLSIAASRIGVNPAWHVTLEKMTGYSEKDLASAVDKIAGMLPVASG